MCIAAPMFVQIVVNHVKFKIQMSKPGTCYGYATFLLHTQ